MKKASKVVTGACMIWTILSLYQSIANIILLKASNDVTTTHDDGLSGDGDGVDTISITNEQQKQQQQQMPYILRNPLTRILYRGNHNAIITDRQHHPRPQQQQQQQQLQRIAELVQQEVLLTRNGTYENDWKSRSYPRWGATTDQENQNGMDVRPLMDFIVNSSVVAYARRQDKFHPNYIATTDHSDAVGKWFPEVLYVIDHRGVYISLKHRNITALESSMMTDKLMPTEKLMSFAIQLLQLNVKYSNKVWPRLSKRLIHTTDPATSGFPMLYWFGDYTECNYQNWKYNLSVPLFTNAASTNCNYSLPFVTYQTGRDSNINWTDVIVQQHLQYPWETKIQKVIWRGGLTGKMINATHKSPRWNMVQMVHELQRDYNTNMLADKSSTTAVVKLDPNVLDVRATRLPPRHKDWRPSLVPELGGLVSSMSMEDFQLYRGIIDMDGNSWSSRFGRLLCYNSVVLKVEPTWVDYFYYKSGWDGEEKLQPWIHYIPVKADLSDLLEMANFVADPHNDDFLIQMVDTANGWCSRNMVRRRLSMDILNIWERYVTLFDIANPHWVQENWKPTKETIFHPSSPLVMDITEIGVASNTNAMMNSDRR